MTESVHYQKSSLREKIVEHVFIGEALRMLWRKKIFDAEILRSEFDAFGYDLVLERGDTTRHVQLKSGLGNPAELALRSRSQRRNQGAWYMCKSPRTLIFRTITGSAQNQAAHCLRSINFRSLSGHNRTRRV
ncbi:MAG TPA: hypothetical protein VHU87_05365 [Rhizomicrobium sp.]|jgi:hypothetical protein|nr:hypothetical protein [Rhizomicrobium sp.]